MKVLIGTTNPSKVRRFEEFLEDCDVQFYTLRDLNITAEPEESGCAPDENAAIKAQFYGQFFDAVIGSDSGLYFAELPLDDPRQPGLHIRTPNGGNRLDDEEMITYYSKLIHSLGGRVTAYYLDGLAVWNKGTVSTFISTPEQALIDSFYMVDTPSDNRRKGWPLDSLSLNRTTLTYFTESGNAMLDAVDENVIIGDYRKRVVTFLKQSLGLD